MSLVLAVIEVVAGQRLGGGEAVLGDLLLKPLEGLDRGFFVRSLLQELLADLVRVLEVFLLPWGEAVRGLRLPQCAGGQVRGRVTD